MHLCSKTSMKAIRNGSPLNRFSGAKRPQRRMLPADPSMPLWKRDARPFGCTPYALNRSKHAVALQVAPFIGNASTIRLSIMRGCWWENHNITTAISLMQWQLSPIWHGFIGKNRRSAPWRGFGKHVATRHSDGQPTRNVPLRWLIKAKVTNEKGFTIKQPQISLF